MPTFLRRRAAALRAEPERGSVMAVLLLLVVFTMLALTMVTSTLNLSLSSRASKIRSFNADTLNSLRTQVIGGLNSGQIAVGNGATPITLPTGASGCDDAAAAFAQLGLNFNHCAASSFALPAGGNGHDDTTATGNVKMTVNLEAWQSGPNSAKLADLTSSFQAYGTCVTGYVPGTGTGEDNPAVYTPCAASTPAADRHILWVARDSDPTP